MCIYKLKNITLLMKLLLDVQQLPKDQSFDCFLFYSIQNVTFFVLSRNLIVFMSE